MQKIVVENLAVQIIDLDVMVANPVIAVVRFNLAITNHTSDGDKNFDEINTCVFITVGQN